MEASVPHSQGVVAKASLLAPWARVLAALLVLVAGAAFPAILWIVRWADDPPVTPYVLLQLVTVAILAPAGLGRLLLRCSAASLTTQGDHFRVIQARRRIEVPLASIDGLEIWRLPLPQPGLSVRLHSGKRLRWGLSAPDLRPIETLLRAASPPMSPASLSPRAFAKARASAVSGSWWGWVAKYPLYALIPTVILFRAHQYIAFGGLWGEWYLRGPAPWLKTLAVYWGTTTLYTLLFAGTLRVFVEPALWVLTAGFPQRADRLRNAAEILLRVVYYAGVPLLLALRFADW